VRTRGLPLRDAKDTRLFLAGVIATLALLVYLAVAFVRTHAAVFPTASNQPSKIAPWSPSASKLVPGRRLKYGGYAVRVTPATRRPGTVGSYGALVQTLIPNPVPGREYIVRLGLRGARPGPIHLELNEFRGSASRYPVKTTVPATAKWRDFTFRTRVRGSWLGLALYVYRVDRGRRTWFAVRGLTVSNPRR